MPAYIFRGVIIDNNLIGCVYGMIKVIAIGNRFMMDDGIAVAVMESLMNKLKQQELKSLLGKLIFSFAFII